MNVIEGPPAGVAPTLSQAPCTPETATPLAAETGLPTLERVLVADSEDPALLAGVELKDAPPGDDWSDLIHRAHAGVDTAERTDALLRAAQFEGARDSCVAVALENLHDRDPNWRIAAVTALREVDVARFANEFAEALRDQSPSVRSAALFALSRCHDWSRLPPHVQSDLISRAERARDKVELRTYREMFSWVRDSWFEQALAVASDRLLRA